MCNSPNNKPHTQISDSFHIQKNGISNIEKSAEKFMDRDLMTEKSPMTVFENLVKNIKV